MVEGVGAGLAVVQVWWGDPFGVAIGAFSGAERQFEPIRDPSKLVAAARDLVANADNSDLRTLAAELPSYLASRNAPVDWITDAVAQRVPGVAEKQAEAVKKRRQVSILAHNAQNLMRSFKADTNPPELLSPIQVDGRPYNDGYSG